MLPVGELAALATAVSWTGSSLFFGYASRRVGGAPVNLFRICAAVPVLVVLHAILAGTVWPGELSERRVLLLAASGIVGLVLGDLGYFHALAILGPRISSVLMATWPSMALLLGWITAGEVPAGREVLGIAMTTLGVALVLLRAREGSAWSGVLTPRRRLLGILGALCGALGQAAGVALARPALQAGPDLPAGALPIAATLVRMTAAAVTVLLLALAQRRLSQFALVVRGGALRHTLLGTLFGPIVGIWLSMVAVQQAQRTGTAAALMALSPLFMMPVARFAYGAHIGWFGFSGTLLTVAGAVVLVAG